MWYIDIFHFEVDWLSFSYDWDDILVIVLNKTISQKLKFTFYMYAWKPLFKTSKLEQKQAWFFYNKFYNIYFLL